MPQPIVKTVMTLDEIREWRIDWTLGHPQWMQERDAKICFVPSMLIAFLRDHADAVLTDNANDRPVYPGACLRTPLETLLISRLNQLRAAANEFLEAESDHGGFFHPEKLRRKRAARQALVDVLAPVSGMNEPSWREQFNQQTLDGIDLAWQNEGPAA